MAQVAVPAKAVETVKVKARAAVMTDTLFATRQPNTRKVQTNE